MNENKLRHIFQQALCTTLVSPLLLSSPNVGATSPMPPPTDFQAPRCEVNRQLSVEGLALPVIPDVLSFRTRYSGVAGARPDTTLSQTGVACTTAQDPAACWAAFNQVPVQTGFKVTNFWGPMNLMYFFATTKGDAVSAVDSVDALKDFFGAIDTEQEAAFLAFTRGNISCDGDAQRGGVRQVADGYEALVTRGEGCGKGNDIVQVQLHITADGEITEVAEQVLQPGDPMCAIGRRPEGIACAQTSPSSSALGRHFASAAYLEAASVPAFTRLARELRAQGAPEALVKRAMAAARDEVRHTQMTRELAQKRGASVERPRVGKLPVRDLSETALENAVEGCVRETYGALLAHHQAAHAKDAEIRAAMAVIAEDETQHAALSWDVAEWLESKLSLEQRASLRHHRDEAIRTLREEAMTAVSTELEVDAGWPSTKAALALIGQLETTLWN